MTIPRNLSFLAQDYVQSTGNLTTPQIIASNGLFLNSNTISASYTIPTGQNGMSAGPVTVASGQAVTVASGSRWIVL
jgi:hypothetical protein